jgi:hypothetical protein
MYLCKNSSGYVETILYLSLLEDNHFEIDKFKSSFQIGTIYIHTELSEESGI